MRTTARQARIRSRMDPRTQPKQNVLYRKYLRTQPRSSCGNAERGEYNAKQDVQVKLAASIRALFIGKTPGFKFTLTCEKLTAPEGVPRRSRSSWSGGGYSEDFSQIDPRPRERPKRKDLPFNPGSKRGSKMLAIEGLWRSVTQSDAEQRSLAQATQAAPTAAWSPDFWWSP